AVKLYERCLIVCANSPDYWTRYADFMEAKGGREIANYSLDRATKVYLKDQKATKFKILGLALTVANPKDLEAGSY
ncbi:pre-mRNA-processing factor 39-like, partial [Trifolium medium]|nr:pre-mRNA-processing factor 39-like [Trifolium medium]